MPISSKESLFSFLERCGRGAKKSLSQNFLINEDIARKIVETVPCTKEEILFEIGPGPGVLTELILAPPEGLHFQQPKRLIVIEKDEQFAKELYRLEQKGEIELSIVCGDAMELIEREIKKERVDIGEKRRVHLLSNVPYNITSTLFKKIFSLKEQFASITFMLQEEVARKIILPSHPTEASFLSIFLAYHTEKMSYAFFVPRNSFFPIPNVDSAVVHMVPRKRALLGDRNEESSFFSLVQTAFSMKRKTLGASLKEYRFALDKAGIAHNARPQELNLEQWLYLFTTIYTKT